MEVSVYLFLAEVLDAAVEGNCSDTGIAVSNDKRYIASPGYPALITGSSVCLWTIEAPPGYNVDFSVREYLLRDDPGKLFVKIREVKKNGMGMKFDRTAQKDLTFTMSGNVEILLFTHDSKSGHRLWLEYRLVDDSSLEHLKLFPLPNRTTCGFPVMNTTTSTGVSTVNSSRNNSSHGTNHTRLNSTLTLLEGHTTERPSDAYFTPGMTYPPTRSSPNVTKTGVGSKDPPNTGITIAVVVCTIGIACCLAAIWVMRKHRHHKAPGRAVNCLISDTYTLEYDRSSRSSTPTTARGPHVNQAQLVGINHPPLDIAEIMRQSEIIRQKKTLRFSDDIEKVICDSPPVLESGDFPPIDFKKYIITDKNDTPEPGPDIENHV
ncbi:uncharacterized protein LOC135477066 [Liolophura sinensis]|uniref:uncharacterized protein LOC135477066 n=1 Tax=Liolophura sinensis TaxID=3198878 RepID=UPI003158C43C